MQLSASKANQGGLTTLEMQAQNIVREDDQDSQVEVNNEEKYNALLESRKNRRAVSHHILPFALFFLTTPVWHVAQSKQSHSR